MLNAIAEFGAHGVAPTVRNLADRTRLSLDRARKCLTLLEEEGFVSVAPVNGRRLRVELVRDPDDAELRAAIEARGVRP
jgi:DNA-binding transcriptional regulator YhcF (GntR family)